MVEFVSKTGTKMFVADERKEEYLAMGYTMANSVCDEAKTEVVEKPVKKTTRKTTTKKKEV